MDPTTLARLHIRYVELEQGRQRDIRLIESNLRADSKICPHCIIHIFLYNMGAIKCLHLPVSRNTLALTAFYSADHSFPNLQHNGHDPCRDIGLGATNGSLNCQVLIRLKPSDWNMWRRSLWSLAKPPPAGVLDLRSKYISGSRNSYIGDSYDSLN